jgi:L-aspartate oxidase
VDAAADFLVIGSGIAALRATIGLAGAGSILLLTKAEPGEGSTGYAQGGIAAAVGPDDSPARHAADTLAAGDGLCDPAAVEVLVHEGPRYVRELAEWGAAFDRDADGRLALAREAAHGVRRVIHARDQTGREIARTLWARAREAADLRVLCHAMVLDLLVEDGVAAGVRFLDAGGAAREVQGRAVLLATGGAGYVYRVTTNPPVATGDGIAMGIRASARVADLEFVQFHPTLLCVEGAPPFLLSEALRGEGARLVNEAGDAFMARYEPARELAPRDRVARAIVREMARTGGRVFLSLRHLPPAWVRERFPAIAAACRAAGLDLATDLLPVTPAAHYVMGGVATDLDGRTSVPGLFAAGEVACTGVHGANRLASNSLLEGLVFGARAALAMRRFVARGGAGDWPDDPGGPARPGPALFREIGPVPLEAGAVRDAMWRDVGVLRHAGGLRRAQALLEEALAAARGAPAPPAHEARRAAETTNLVTVGRLVARAALRREESRGAHYREDFPARDDRRWLRRISEREP